MSMPHNDVLETADVHTISQHIQSQIDTHWKATLEQNAAKLEDAYARAGDMAYGTYLGLLFRPINRQLKAAGFKLEPDLPGDLDLSREWGNGIDKTQQQRWMWSLIRRENGQPVGAIAVVVFHDHSGFKLPQVPLVVALEQASNAEVIEALCAQQPTFGEAKAFTVEVEEYMAAQALEESNPVDQLQSNRDFIEIRGARENNLKNVSVDIPKHQITVFTGVSGSGKSSLVFDTIAAEAQRQLNETFTSFVQGFMPSYGQPDVDSIENLNAPIIINQKRVGGGSRSTVGTFTDISVLLRLLFSKVGQPFAGPAFAFGFNNPQGMCLECEGIGKTVQLDLGRLLDIKKSLNEGAILHPEFKVGGWIWKTYSKSELFDNDQPLEAYSTERWQQFLHGVPGLKVAFSEFNLTFEGVAERFTRMYIKKDAAAMSDRNRAVFEKFVDTQTCPVCHGARLNQGVLDCRIDTRNIAECSDLEATELIRFLQGFIDPVAVKLAAKLTERLEHLVDIGLGYLSLSRETSTLSGGESQRIKMIRHLGNSLTDMLYILDEPSVGLHARDVARLTGLLRKLRDKGNTVLVVEHDPDVIAVADHIVDLGPRAGTHGGEIVFEGSVEELRKAKTLTGEFLRQSLPLKLEVRVPTGKLKVENANLNNLKNVSVNLPTGVLTVVTGVAGSGKSTLINDVFLEQYPNTIVVDQARVTSSVRSAPATYTGIMDEIRSAFAKANKVSASLFSFNSSGSCPNCNGLGVTYTDLAFMDGITSSCEVCEGKRFKAEVLEFTLRGKTISDVLEMTVEDALEYFNEKKIRAVVQAMFDVGLGYLKLGQPLSTVSGGEGQRLKLATELHKAGSVYVMDEPTTGLHLSDIGRLMAIIDRLVDAGNTVILIEHHLDVIRQADWIIDLGPEGGNGGGEILFEGVPRDLLNHKRSITANYLTPEKAFAN
jgi:excinuclease UvrABC ATPase subunit